MQWFEGSIPAAITSAKQRNVVFVVVITGDDEQSSQLLSSWDDVEVSEAAQNSCVAIKVDANSETCVQFSQIYPVMCIPSSFFIGHNGIPLEVIAGSVSTEELMKRINGVKQMHAKQIHGGIPLPETATLMDTSPCDSTTTDTSSSQALPPTSAAKQTRTQIAAAEAVAAAAAASANMHGVTLRPREGINASSSYGAQCSKSEENLDAKVERLTKKLEERREQRKKGEEESELRKEIERRKLGKDMLDFKRKQEEEKNRRLLEERNREKAEEKAARERVKQQIALDRAERAARYAQKQEEDKASKQAALQARQLEQEAKKEAVLRERSVTTRIQFRLPDGSSFTNQFPSQSRLEEARQFAVQKLENRYGNFSLATVFPRREFVNEDFSKTLLELELTPSASIIVLPSGKAANSVVQSSGGGIWAVLSTILYPLLAVSRFLSTFLFATPPPPAAPRGNTHQSESYTNLTPNSSDKSKRKTLEKQPKNFKQDGKICRLRTQDDSEDDNNTWNGNSTQQM
ncbi:UBX domain-containing protein 4 isoform X2 [Thalassophryne amazonica]|uniref:UBX domain-containing protein 4 isoform X2 n=1 Tax=Thalassophryne amazonica TaxID=390379 RepID=UPI001471B28B|nr:UBX domain-containing protein 4 isoform X2 [Thalassophryne amazonica]